MNEKRRARRLRVFNAIRKTPPEPLAPPDAHDQDEVAAMLDVRVGTIHSRLSRGLDQLRDQLGVSREA